MIISETQPPPLPSYVDGVERGLDPWHADAFKGISGIEGRFVSDNPRKAGWYYLDWCGNVLGFIADGTEVATDA